MTWHQARAALDLDGLTSTQKFVLIALALRAGTDGRAWPSIARLTADTGYSRRAVQYALEWLGDAELIEVVRKPGRAATMTLGGALVAQVGVQEVHGGVQEVHKTRARGAPRSVVEVNQEVATPGTTPSVPVAANGKVKGGGPRPGESWGEYRERGGR